MEEQLISFETAKLAHEKRFTRQTVGHSFTTTKRNYYNSTGDLNGDCSDFIKEVLKNKKYNYPTKNHILYPACSQNLLQTWLRNKHGLFAYIDWATNEAVCLDYKNTDGKELIREDTYDFVPDHEDGEVLERLLFETLKFI